MQLSYILGFHSGINNLPFLLFLEVTLLGIFLKMFREKVTDSFSKRKYVEGDSASWRYNHDFSLRNSGRILPNDEGV